MRILLRRRIILKRAFKEQSLREQKVFMMEYSDWILCGPHEPLTAATLSWESHLAFPVLWVPLSLQISLNILLASTPSNVWIYFGPHLPLPLTSQSPREQFIAPQQKLVGLKTPPWCVGSQNKP
jgi:hypothetical protein